MSTQNKAWAEIKSKVGFKMLENMGWTEGKGLGKNGDGVTTHVRVKRRLNTRGIGTEASAASAWKAPSEVASSFNDVLARIGGAVESNDAAEASAGEESADTPCGTSMKNGFLSRRRHGKDVRTYSDADLRAIFGGVDLARPPTVSNEKRPAGRVEKKSKGKKNKEKSRKMKKLE